MSDATDLPNDGLNQRDLDRDTDELGKALHKAYPKTTEDEGEADRFRWLIRALALEATGKVIASRGQGQDL